MRPDARLRRARRGARDGRHARGARAARGGVDEGARTGLTPTDQAEKPLVRGPGSVLPCRGDGPPPRDRHPARAPGSRAELPAPVSRHARLGRRHLARPRRARGRRLAAHALVGLDRRAADRRHAADLRDRHARRAARRPALAAAADGRRRPRPLRRVRRAAVHDERDADRRPGRGRGGRDRLLPAGRRTPGCRTSSRTRTCPSANALLQTVDNLTWALGSLVGGALVAASGVDAAYWINACTFLISAVFLYGIPQRLLQASAAASRGHWADLKDGFSLTVRSKALLTVLIAWNVAMFANAAVNVAEPRLAFRRLRRRRLRARADDGQRRDRPRVRRLPGRSVDRAARARERLRRLARR